MDTQNKKNNFQKLSEIKEQKYPHAISEVENNIMGTIRSAQITGSIIDLYMHKLMATISSFFGAKPNNNSTKFEAGHQDDDNSTPIGNIK